MKEVLGIIGAVVATIVVLGVPIMSFMSLIYDWPGFLGMVFIVGLAVDFLFVFNMFMQEVEK